MKGFIFIIYKFFKANFKKEFKITKKVVGAGATSADFEIYAKSSKNTGI
jgi:hypothetical protein